MKKLSIWLTALLIAAGLGIIIPGPASAATSYCGLTWGSLAKAAPDTGAGSVTNVRSGRQACYDRLVIDLNGRTDGYRVEYVSVITSDGKGEVIPVRGGARLRIVALAPAYNDSGSATYLPANPKEVVNVAGYQTFRQVVWAGSYEGQTTLGLGVRARLPFRAFTLVGPGGGSRLVIDVAHFW
ncbi:hypothetical protein ASF72_05035 [Arthrobacter sp. Leaf141]|jgi:hypothetical protein|uniref:AMIN-like domain-containing (lipo)protein n=1 Tax=Micrococcaceae TaxID=1268 RepID=UPI0006FA431B|nr:MULTISPECIES: hypothetical protein [Micrococcaceae]KQR03690.1 hypothetical protein ASF72_05035 [Arthrobacter sp. Leaf141]